MNTRRRGPRLYHKKSRLGCKRCKARRVKCDERHPTCTNCARHGVPCEFDHHPDQPPDDDQQFDSAEQSQSNETPGSLNGTQLSLDSNVSQTSPESTTSFSKPISANGHTTSATTDPFSLPISDPEDLDIPESRSRRLLELRLQQNYLANLCQPFPVSQSPEVTRIWEHDLPTMALTHDNLLHALHALSATYLLHHTPPDDHTTLLEARDRYLALALREQRSAVANLSALNADSVCFASSLIQTNSFACLAERSLTPYRPPTEWLRLGRGSGTMFKLAMYALQGCDTSKIMTVVRAPPSLKLDESTFTSAENRRVFAHLLKENLPPLPRNAADISMSSSSSNPPPRPDEIVPDPRDPLTPSVRETYSRAIAYLGSIQRSLAAEEPIYAICRRLHGFALHIPEDFIVFVSERRPRALVVLAHFFALVAMIAGKDVWWIEGIGAREVRAIDGVLPGRWRGLMPWEMADARMGSL